MRLIILFAVMTVAGTATPASAQSPLSDEPIVQVGLFSYRDDGTVQGSAYDTEPSLSSVVYVNGSLCQLGAGNRPQPATAADAWRFTGRVVSKTAEEAVMQLDWQRILEDGRVTVAPGETVQLTLKAGDRLLLDSVLPRTQLSCGVASVGFEARYRTRFSEFPQLREHMKSSGARAGGAGRDLRRWSRNQWGWYGEWWRWWRAYRTDLRGCGNCPRAGRSQRDPSRSRPHGERESLAGTQRARARRRGSSSGAPCTSRGRRLRVRARDHQRAWRPRHRAGDRILHGAHERGIRRSATRLCHESPGDAGHGSAERRRRPGRNQQNRQQDAGPRRRAVVRDAGVAGDRRTAGVTGSVFAARPHRPAVASTKLPVVSGFSRTLRFGVRYPPPSVCDIPA